jgi:ribonuclease HI
MEYPVEDALNIYTDGSSLPTPRRGGLAVLLLLINDKGEEEEYDPPLLGYSAATNQQMELQACLEGLKLATAQHPYFDRSRFRKIVIKSDSIYVVENYGSARHSWPQNSWKTRSGKPVDNAKQWQELVKLVKRSEGQGKPVRFEWVKGKKSPRTKAVDKGAKKSAKASSSNPQLTDAEVRRKMTDQPLEIGSVGMEGQMMTIRVFKTEFQPVHKLEKVWYTVLSKKSPFYKKASVIYAAPELGLRRGHSYRVRVGSDSRDPRVTKVFAEID